MTKKANTSAFDQFAGADFLGADSEALLKNGGRSVERILVELIRPDPVQPRRVLPYDIHLDYHSERINAIQAMRRYIDMVRDISRNHGRGWTELQELIDYEGHLTAEEETLRDLVSMAITLHGGSDNQVLPATVVDVSQGAVIQYRIETGERRFWAEIILIHFLPGYDGDGTMDCIIINEQQFSFFRQARENSSRSGYTAIATARQAALLLLAVNGVQVPAGVVYHDFYRQALDLDMRGYSNEILTAMGGIARNTFSNFKALLALSNEALELADRHHVEEGKLRFVLKLPDNQQADMVQQIIEQGLTVQQVKAMVEGRHVPSKKTSTTLPRPAIQFAKLFARVNKVQPRYIALAVLEQVNTPAEARAEIAKLRALLDEAEAVLKE